MIKIKEFLTEEEAFWIVDPYFEQCYDLVKNFLETSEKPILVVLKDANFLSGCDEDGAHIYVSNDIVNLPSELVLDIILHEFGHAIDLKNPGKFLIESNVKLSIKNDFEKKRLIRWKMRKLLELEKTANLIIKTLTGIDVFYEGPCFLKGCIKLI